MTDLVIPNSFEAGQVAVAGDVNDNFAAVVAWSSTVVPDTGAIFATTPTFPESTVGLGAYQGTHKTYVDNKFKSNTGIQLGGHTPGPANVSAEWATVATATTGTAIPVNTTNPILLLSMFGNIELEGIAAAVQGSFGMKLEYCFDTDAAGTTGTWTSIGTMSDTTVLIGGIAYGGISMSGFAFAVPNAPKIVGVRMRVINRGGNLTSVHTGTPRLYFQLTRQVALA